MPFKDKMSVKIQIDRWVKIKSETTSSAVALRAMAGQARLPEFGEDVKKTFGFK